MFCYAFDQPDGKSFAQNWVSIHNFFFKTYFNWDQRYKLPEYDNLCRSFDFNRVLICTYLGLEMYTMLECFVVV